MTSLKRKPNEDPNCPVTVCEDAPCRADNTPIVRALPPTRRGAAKALAFSTLLLAALATPLADTSAQAAGLLTPADGTGTPLSIVDHDVDVVVEDGYAITTVEQTFANPGTRDDEALYSFPVPKKAAVAEFTYWIDGAPVSGEVVEKQRAREIYQSEKQAGREVAYTEQDAYKTFDTKVWPVRAGQDVRVRLSYIQPVNLDTGIGRYLYPLEEGGVDEQKLSFWTANETVTGRFTFDLELKADYPVEAVRLPAHPNAVITRSGRDGWHVHLDNTAPAQAAPAAGNTAANGTEEETTPAAPVTQPVRLDTDVVVYWREKAGLPGSLDMTAYKAVPDGRGTYMLTLTPGVDHQPITGGRDWVFVLDKSGSMSGKIATLAEGVAKAVGKLRPEDRFRLVAFDQQAHPLTSGFLPATPGEVARAVDIVRNMQPGGSTNLFAGLDMGLSGLDDDRPAGVILVTDGVANDGVTERKRFVERIKTADIRLFTVVMGNSANEPLLGAMTRASGGTSLNVSNSDDIVGALMTATSKLTHTALHDVKVKLDPAGGDLRLADMTGNDVRSLYRGEQLILFGHYWGKGPADITLTAKLSGKPVSYSTTFEFPETTVRNPEIERLWAFSAIEREMWAMEMLDEGADAKQAVIDLSKEYGIVTPFTSMIVVRDEVFQKLAIDRTNDARLKREAKAQEQRRQPAATPKSAEGNPAPVRTASRRVDSNKPMFSQPRSGHGGGGGSGDVGLVGLGLMGTAAAGAYLARRRRARGAQ
ncbi:VIT and vWA domain-containing protein [Rhodobium gokarnense]|uniref:Ca-activated chloride channel family protein n=1 Tax=Rhodobium gokarnense TaxID=364296 RepID=A0ABT3H9W7_9HYPH|nr:VIT and VWA domain-containing protein [Rhodobium gokarnense]MCW2307144.1 Ca-activated chloride channel family protein [Rhodobium gokarnense]